MVEAARRKWIERNAMTTPAHAHNIAATIAEQLGETQRGPIRRHRPETGLLYAKGKDGIRKRCRWCSQHRYR